MIVPCLDCTKRQVGCHATCKDYQKFREYIDEQNEKKKAMHKEYDDFFNSVKRSNKRRKR